MPNIYATPIELKSRIPDSLRQSNVDYDSLFLRLANAISRHFDRLECQRRFYPEYGTRYFNGYGDRELWIDDLLELGTMSYSDDDGVNYTAYTSNDYYLTRAGDYNHPGSYTLAIANVSSAAAISYFPAGQRSIKFADCFWGCADDRTAAFEDSQDEVENNPLAADGTSITVNDADGADLWGLTPRFQAGQVLRIESELLEVTAVNPAANTLAVIRGRNGSSAAAHNQNTTIKIWRAPEPVQQALAIQVIRQMERGFQGYGDARSTPDLGSMMFIKAIDPEARALLAPYKRQRAGVMP